MYLLSSFLRSVQRIVQKTEDGRPLQASPRQSLSVLSARRHFSRHTSGSGGSFSGGFMSPAAGATAAGSFVYAPPPVASSHALSVVVADGVSLLGNAVANAIAPPPTGSPTAAARNISRPVSPTDRDVRLCVMWLFSACLFCRLIRARCERFAGCVLLVFTSNVQKLGLRKSPSMGSISLSPGGALHPSASGLPRGSASGALAVPGAAPPFVRLSSGPGTPHSLPRSPGSFSMGRAPSPSPLPSLPAAPPISSSVPPTLVLNPTPPSPLLSPAASLAMPVLGPTGSGNSSPDSGPATPLAVADHASLRQVKHSVFVISQ